MFIDKCQVYGHSESQGKILEIASQLGKSTGLVISSRLTMIQYVCIRIWVYSCPHSLIKKKPLNLFDVGLLCVDCSASSDTTVVLKEVIHMGCCIVLANKRPLTSTLVTEF